MTYEGFLQFIITPSGLQTVLGVVAGLVLEFVPRLATFTDVQKRMLIYGAALVLPLVSVGLGILTLGWPATWPGVWWQALQAGALFVVGAAVPGGAKAAAATKSLVRSMRGK